MADGTKIEWTDATWNIVNGCSVLSPGCTNCYAMQLAGTRLRNHPSRAGLTIDTKAGPVWNGEVRFNEKALLDPIKWRRPRKIFVCAHGDLFHDSVPDEWIDRVFAVMALCPEHIFQVLTKRSARMREYFAHPGRGEAINKAGFDAGIEVPVAGGWRTFSGKGGINLPLSNLWLGVSVEDQARADERIPDLLATPAAVRFLSCEPLLGAVDLTAIQAPRYVPEDHEIDWKFNCLETGDYYYFQDADYTEGGDGPQRDSKIDWVIVGGESGPGARPMDNRWAQSLVDQCKACGTAAFVKQLSNGVRANHDIGTFPEGLRVREFPHAA